MLGQLIFINSACVWLLGDVIEEEKKKQPVLLEWGMEGNKGLPDCVYHVLKIL